jgi:hypothetical protein
LTIEYSATVVFRPHTRSVYYLELTVRVRGFIGEGGSERNVLSR